MKHTCAIAICVGSSLLLVATGSILTWSSVSIQHALDNTVEVTANVTRYDIEHSHWTRCWTASVQYEFVWQNRVYHGQSACSRFSSEEYARRWARHSPRAVHVDQTDLSHSALCPMNLYKTQVILLGPVAVFALCALCLCCSALAEICVSYRRRDEEAVRLLWRQ